MTPEELLSTLRTEIDDALDRRARFSDDAPKRLVDAARYSLLAPGKRLRPTLVLLAAELCGGERSAAIPAAVAVEAIHSYSLIHDDLPAMDDDDLRRGRPTCHRRFDEATAILAGDALSTFAFEALTDLPDARLAARCVLELSRAAGPCGMVGGQADDVLWGEIASKSPSAFDLAIGVANASGAALPFGSNDAAILPFLQKIHRRKTGEMIRVSLVLGALIGSAGSAASAASDSVEPAPSGSTPPGLANARLRRLDLFGRAFGQAFQISDDILDATGTEEEMGKRVQKDGDAGKLTYATLLGLDESRRLLAARIADAQNALAPAFDATIDAGAPFDGPLFDANSPAFAALNYLTDNLARRRK